MTDLNLEHQVILLVDDVTYSRATVERLLRTLGDPSVIPASDGSEALGILQATNAIDFVISDFKMPEVNGLELLKAIRSGQAGVDRDMPVALLTGYSDRKLVDMAMDLDVNAFLIKPVSKAALTSRLERLMAQAEDTSWLKPADDYVGVNIREPLELDEDGEAPTDKGTVAPLEASGDEEDPAAAPQAGRPSSAVDWADMEDPSGRPPKGLSVADWAEIVETSGRAGLAKHDAARKRASRPAPQADAGPEKTAGEGTRPWVAEGGTAMAQRLVWALEGLQQTGNTSLEQAARNLTAEAGGAGPGGPGKAVAKPPSLSIPGDGFYTLDALPDGSILDRDLHTPDGSLLLFAGTPLTEQVVAVVTVLDAMGLLALHTSDAAPGGVRGLFVRASGARAPSDARGAPGPRDGPGAGVVSVKPQDLQPGSVLADDLRLPDGRAYLSAGVSLTERHIALLRDLGQLGLFQGGLPIQG